MHSLFDVTEDHYDRHVKRDTNKSALRSDDQLRYGYLDVPYEQVIQRSDLSPVEHDIRQHGGHHELESARQTLNARERTVRWA